MTAMVIETPSREKVAPWCQEASAHLDDSRCQQQRPDPTSFRDETTENDFRMTAQHTSATEIWRMQSRESFVCR